MKRKTISTVVLDRHVTAITFVRKRTIIDKDAIRVASISFDNQAIIDFTWSSNKNGNN